jgi:hypothetical protein
MAASLYPAVRVISHPIMCGLGPRPQTTKVEHRMKRPIHRMKETFGDKKKLVEAVEKFTGEELWLGRANPGKGLAHVSNAKLLRLHATFSLVKEKFGTRFKLIDSILDLESRAKDDGYRTRLLAYPVPRLWDMYQSAEKRKSRATKAAEAPKGKAAAPAAKAVKKAAPKAKPAVTKKKLAPKA